MSRESSRRNIPKQKTGAKSDTTHNVVFPTPQEAVEFFPVVKTRLLDVSNWEKLCGTITANFILTDSKGNEVNRLAREGDHFKIDIPGPGSVTGNGYDWVSIEKIDHRKEEKADYEEVSIKVRPASNPTNSSDNVAHFFDENATSTFMVIRKGASLRAEVHGRNELPNTRPKHKIDWLRNILVAIGAMIGLSKSQWSQLVKGLLAKEDK